MMVDEEKMALRVALRALLDGYLATGAKSDDPLVVQARNALDEFPKDFRKALQGMKL